jgi:precorrin-6A/cobalt-precorrin-6A reductase
LAAAPDEPVRVLILGGTGEAAALARRLETEPRVHAITSLAGRTRRPATVPGDVRVGGFGGAAGLADYLAREGVRLVVDATHPFAAAISQHAADACRSAGVPLLRLSRPPWAPVAGDRWTEVPDMAAAADAVMRLGERVFLSAGRQDLSAFAHISDVWFLVRTIEPLDGPGPLANSTLIQGRGPFGEDDESALLRSHAVDLVVSKNSGGSATYPKIAAARGLGLPVVMIERPPALPGDHVEDIEDAVAWIAAHLE